jgi:hypothetical protein
VEWYDNVEPKTTCQVSHQEMQLNQWAKCLSAVESYEKSQHASFDSVIKLRPDDLWYGLMFPHCVLDHASKVYIARQEGRWSDQWFSLPRKIATPIFSLISKQMKPVCLKGSIVSTVLYRAQKDGFEFQIFEHIREYASLYQMHVVPLFLPRILARTEDHRSLDVKEKCARFLPDVLRENCNSTVRGRDPILVGTWDV